VTDPDALAPTDPSLSWHGLIDLVPDGPSWWQPWRLPPGKLLGGAAPDRLVERAAMPAGVRLAVVTDAAELIVDVELSLLDGTVAADLVLDGQATRRITLSSGANRIRATLPGRRCEVQLWLPQWGRLRIGRIQLPGASSIEPYRAGTARWITYGSSITQCATVAGPLDTWPARVAHSQDWDLLCLGFDGEAHLDPIVAHTIAAEPADLISLCIGVNIHSRASYSDRTLPGAVAEFVNTIRAGHPVTPIAVITPLFSPARETAANNADMTLVHVRELVAAAVDGLIERGDRHLHAVHGPDILGATDTGHLYDGLHPDPGGYALIAERLTPHLTSLLLA
jgi:hypothetical protein